MPVEENYNISHVIGRPGYYKDDTAQRSAAAILLMISATSRPRYGPPHSHRFTLALLAFSRRQDIGDYFRGRHISLQRRPPRGGRTFLLRRGRGGWCDDLHAHRLWCVHDDYHADIISRRKVIFIIWRRHWFLAHWHLAHNIGRCYFACQQCRVASQFLSAHFFAALGFAVRRRLRHDTAHA